MGRPVNFSLALAAADPDGIATAQSAAFAGDFVLDGALVVNGVAILGDGMVERQVSLTQSAGEGGRLFTVYGKNASGGDIREVVDGFASPSTVTSQLHFQEVSRVSTDAATAGTISIGTTDIGSSGWVVVDRHRDPVNVGFGVTLVSGGINYTVQHTYDPLQFAAPNFIPNVFPHPVVAAAVASASDFYLYPISALRVQINSGLGVLDVGIVQAGLRDG